MPSTYTNALVVCVGAEEMILIEVHNRNIVKRSLITDKELSSSYFHQTLQNNNIPVYVLLNHAEQSFTVDKINAINKEHAAVLLRTRLNGTTDDIKKCIVTDNTNPRLGKFACLIITASVPSLAYRLIDILLELKYNFQSIILLPLAMVKITHRLAKIYGEDQNVWHMLVAHCKLDGTRQVTLKNGQMFATSLLNIIDDSNYGIVAGSIHQEIEDIILSILKDKAEKQIVNLYVIMPEDIKTSFLLINFSKKIRLHVFTPFELSKALDTSWSTKPTDRFSDTVLSCITLEIISKTEHFQTDRTRKIKRLLFFKRYSNRIFINIFSFLLLIVISLLIYSNSQGNIKDDLINKIGRLKEDLMQLNKSAHVKNNETIYSIMQMYSFLSNLNKSPLEFIEKIQPQAFGESKLISLTWSLDSENNKVISRLNFAVAQSDQQLFEYDKLKKALQKQFTQLQILPLSSNKKEYVSIELRE